MLEKSLKYIDSKINIISRCIRWIPAFIQFSILVVSYFYSINEMTFKAVFLLGSFMAILSIVINFTLKMTSVLLRRNKESLKDTSEGEKETLIAMLIYVLLTAITFMFVH